MTDILKQKKSVYDNHLRFNHCDFSLHFQNKVINSSYGIDGLFNNTPAGLKENEKRKLEGSLKLDLSAVYEKLHRGNIELLCIEDEDYPSDLKHIYAPPALLFLKGRRDLIEQNKFAVVGARKCTPYGKGIAMDFTEKLVKYGYVIVSGMAIGIDTVAHRTALKYGSTIAVLATGIDICYPSYNRFLYDEISKNGLLVTEFFFSTKAEPYRFPIRNRIITGLSDAVLIVEAMLKSGSVLTAKLAIDQGRDVYAVCGDITRPSSVGTNYLIKNAMAYMVSEIGDIIPEYENKRDIELNENEKKVLDLIQSGKSSVDDLYENTGFDMGELSSVLFQLEIKRKILKISNNEYQEVE